MSSNPKEARKTLISGPRQSKAYRQPKFYDESNDHVIQSFGGLIPITAGDHITKALPFSGLFDEASGYVLYVCGRNGYMWNIKGDHGNVKKFQTPTSEIAILGRHVGIAVFPRSTTLVCVTPAGSLRFWKSVSNPSGYSDCHLSLKGQEAHSVIQVSYEKLVVATTSCVVRFINTSNFGYRELNVLSRGKMSRLSTVAAYFLPSVAPSESSEQLRRVLVPVKSEENLILVSNMSVYTVSFAEEKVINRLDFVRIHSSEVIASCLALDPSQFSASDYQVRISDAKFWTNESELVLCLIVKDVRKEAASKETDCKCVFSLIQTDLAIPSKTGDVNIFPSKLTLPLSLVVDIENDEDRLELEVPSAKFCDCLLTTKTKIFYLSSMFMQNPDDVSAACFELSATNDRVVAVGSYQDKTLVLTAKKGIISYTSKLPKHLREFQSLTTLQQTVNGILDQYALEPEKQLMQFFLLFSRAKMSQNRLVSICQSYFSDLSERPDFNYIVMNCVLFISDGSIIELSEPDFDEKMQDLNIPAVLARKLEYLELFLEFLTVSGLAIKLSSIQIKTSDHEETSEPTMVAVHKVIECVVCLTSFYDLHCKHNEFFEPFVRVVMENRGFTVLPNDYMTKFYKAASKFDEIFAVIAEAQKSNALSVNYETANVISELYKDTFARTHDCRKKNLEVSSVSESFCYWNLNDSFLEYVNIHFDWLKKSDVLALSSMSMELIQSQFDLAVLCLKSLSTYFTEIQQMLKGETVLTVEAKVAEIRSAFIEFFFDINQSLHALALAEKFLDFETLIRCCVTEKRFDKLSQYQGEFAEYNFDHYLIKWLYDHNYIEILMKIQSPSLVGFLNNVPELRWVIEGQQKQWFKALTTLHKLCCNDFSMPLRRKRLFLSKAKLCGILAAKNGIDCREMMTDIKTEYSLTDMQMQIDENVKAKYGLSDERVTPSLQYPKLAELLLESSASYATAKRKRFYCETIVRVLNHINDLDVREDLKMTLWSHVISDTNWDVVDVNKPDYLREDLQSLLFNQILCFAHENDLSDLTPEQNDMFAIVDELMKNNGKDKENGDDVKMIIASCFQVLEASSGDPS